MNPLTIGLGVAAFCYGLFTLFLHVTRPAKFGKLAAMKAQWGERLGTAMHIGSYTVAPLVVGASLIFAGVMGVSLFGR